MVTVVSYCTFNDVHFGVTASYMHGMRISSLKLTGTKKRNNSRTMHAKLMQICMMLKKHLTHIILAFLFP